VWQYRGGPNGLIRLPRINTEAGVDFNRLVEVGKRDFT
jgi:hypothetical protein